MTTVTGIPISRLQAAETPLSGSEEVPLVQSGTTKRATVSDIASASFIGQIVLRGVASVALAAGQTDDWAPDLSLSISRLRITPAGAADLTGMVPPVDDADGRVILLTNAGVSDITVFAEDASSAAENRFGMNGDVIVVPNSALAVFYDSSIQRWLRWGM